MVSIASLYASPRKHTIKKTALQSVVIGNEITKDMTGYSYFFINYHPTLFMITVNGSSIQEGDKIPLDVKDGRLEITYYCEFQNGKRKSSKKYQYKLASTTKKVALRFDWHKDPRIMLDVKDAVLERVRDML
jgi:hypothetical protein